MKWALCAFAVALSATASPLGQLPLLNTYYQQQQQVKEVIEGHSSATDELGLTWQEVASVPQIETWALNPTGDAAVIRTRTLDVENETNTWTLHLLAINAQFGSPISEYGPASPSSLYTFLTDSKFLTLSPSDDTDGLWMLSVQYLNYTSVPPYYDPSASAPKVIRRFNFDATPKSLLYSCDTEVVAIVLEGHEVVTGGSLAVVKLSDESITEELTPLAGSNLIIDTVIAGSSQLAIIAHSTDRPWNSTRTDLYTLCTQSFQLSQISSTESHGTVSAPDFATNGKLAWLQIQEDGNARGQRKLWIADGENRWEVKLNFDLSPEGVVWSKNSEAINLLTLYNQEQMFYHLWTPNITSPLVTPTRITSTSTIHEAKHVGITPLNHSHFIAIKSSLASPREVWVVSHSPFEDPTDSFEEVRITFFSEPIMKGKEMTFGERFSFENDLGLTVHGRIFIPKNTANPPVIMYSHGDEDGGGWHDWWMNLMNPNNFVNAGFAVITINPTGTPGYANSYTQTRRYQWGNQTIIDLHQGLQYCFDNYNLNQSRTYGMGYGAYGGFAMHWIQGHQEDWNFSGILAHNGILSPRSWAAETSEPSRVNWEFGKVSYAHDSPFYLWDPERFVNKWSIPELVIYDGTDDGDTGTLAQSIATYNALQSRGIKSQLLRSDSLIEWQHAIFDNLLTW